MQQPEHGYSGKEVTLSMDRCINTALLLTNHLATLATGYRNWIRYIKLNFSTSSSHRILVLMLGSSLNFIVVLSQITPIQGVKLVYFFPSRYKVNLTQSP